MMYDTVVHDMTDIPARYMVPLQMEIQGPFDISIIDTTVSIFSSIVVHDTK